jgi:hypothetical protein
MTDTANEIDIGIRWTEGAVEVDAMLVARVGHSWPRCGAALSTAGASAVSV